MSLQPIMDALGPYGVLGMVVCFIAVLWWAFRKPGRKNGGDDDAPWPGEEGGD